MSYHRAAANVTKGSGRSRGEGKCTKSPGACLLTEAGFAGLVLGFDPNSPTGKSDSLKSQNKAFHVLKGETIAFNYKAPTEAGKLIFDTHVNDWIFLCFTTGEVPDSSNRLTTRMQILAENKTTSPAALASLMLYHFMQSNDNRSMFAEHPLVVALGVITDSDVDGNQYEEVCKAFEYEGFEATMRNFLTSTADTEVPELNDVGANKKLDAYLCRPRESKTMTVPFAVREESDDKGVFFHPWKVSFGEAEVVIGSLFKPTTIRFNRDDRYEVSTDFTVGDETKTLTSFVSGTIGTCGHSAWLAHPLGGLPGFTGQQAYAVKKPKKPRFATSTDPTGTMYTGARISAALLGYRASVRQLNNGAQIGEIIGSANSLVATAAMRRRNIRSATPVQLSITRELLKREPPTGTEEFDAYWDAVQDILTEAGEAEKVNQAAAKKAKEEYDIRRVLADDYLMKLIDHATSNGEGEPNSKRVTNPVRAQEGIQKAEEPASGYQPPSKQERKRARQEKKEKGSRK